MLVPLLSAAEIAPISNSSAAQASVHAERHRIHAKLVRGVIPDSYRFEVVNIQQRAHEDHCFIFRAFAGSAARVWCAAGT